MNYYRQQRERDEERARLRGLCQGITPLALTPASGHSVALQAIGAQPRQNDELRANSLVKQFAAYQCPRPTARLELAVALPPQWGFRGGCTTIQDLGRLGLHRGHLGLTPNMEAAVRLVTRANMEAADSSGSGNRWQRRLHRMRLAEAGLIVNGSAYPADLNRAATVHEETFTEGRSYRHHSPKFLHP